MLIETQQETNDTKTHITFVKGKVELALTEYGIWKFTQSIKTSDTVLDKKTFSFGDNIGVIKCTDSGTTYLKIKNELWYLVTLNNGTIPILKNSNPKQPTKINPKYKELTEIE